MIFISKSFRLYWVFFHNVLAAVSYGLLKVFPVYLDTEMIQPRK